MLFLLFQIGENRYALDARQVAGVLPFINVVEMPQTPPAVAGILDYGGRPVPVVDLCQVLLRRPALRRLHTRIVLVHYSGGNGATNLLGLIAEKATETLRREPADFTHSGLSGPHLGPVAKDENGLAQWVDVNRLLPAPIRDLLFQEAAPH